MNSLPPLELDVRPVLAARGSPLPLILSAVERLEPGQAFRLIAPFEPAPLYQMLGNRGFTHTTRARDDGAYEITFEPTA